VISAGVVFRFQAKASAHHTLQRQTVVDHDLATRREVEDAFGAHLGELAARRFDREAQDVSDLLPAEWQFESIGHAQRTSLSRQTAGQFEEEGRHLRRRGPVPEQLHPVPRAVEIVERAGQQLLLECGWALEWGPALTEAIALILNPKLAHAESRTAPIGTRLCCKNREA